MTRRRCGADLVDEGVELARLATEQTILRRVLGGEEAPNVGQTIGAAVQSAPLLELLFMTEMMERGGGR